MIRRVFAGMFMCRIIRWCEAASDGRTNPRSSADHILSFIVADLSTWIGNLLPTMMKLYGGQRIR